MHLYLYPYLHLYHLYVYFMCICMCTYNYLWILTTHQYLVKNTLTDIVAKSCHFKDTIYYNDKNQSTILKFVKHEKNHMQAPLQAMEEI